MDEPVTDIKFVSAVDHCPAGYNIVRMDLCRERLLHSDEMYNYKLTCVNDLQITKCPCGHDAQLWEKVIGGESGKRYLCFTSDKTVKYNFMSTNVY